jgi:protein-L-isoaspartate(D-aspartate) O-methyltransferase
VGSTQESDDHQAPGGRLPNSGESGYGRSVPNSGESAYDQTNHRDFLAARHHMVRTQIEERGIVDERVLAAMYHVPRHEFAPLPERDRSYLDCPIPIGFGQTMSQPYTVAFMCEALELAGGEKVLEVGTGSGYGAAVLGELAREIWTIERIDALKAQAEATLARLGYANVHVRLDDGTLGLAEKAPFDAICVTAGAKALPPAYVEQLAPEGRIVIPIGEHPRSQTMRRFRKGDAGQLSEEQLGGFAFVPLVGECGWGEQE